MLYFIFLPTDSLVNSTVLTGSGSARAAALNPANRTAIPTTRQRLLFMRIAPSVTIQKPWLSPTRQRGASGRPRWRVALEYGFFRERDCLYSTPRVLFRQHRLKPFLFFLALEIRNAFFHPF